MTSHRLDKGQENLPEGGIERPRKLSAPAGVLSQLRPSRRLVKLLIALTLAGEVPTSVSCQGCRESEPSGIVDMEKEPILMEIHQGDWNYFLYRKREMEIENRYGRTLYHFIQGLLQKKGVFKSISEDDKRATIDAFIHFCRELNPNLDLNDFESINGKTIVFPSFVRVSPHFRETLTPTTGGGYARLQALAERDGFPVTDLRQQQGIYEEAIRTTVPIPKSPFYFRKSEGVEDSPARLAPDVLERFIAFAKEFSETSFGGKKGWQLCFSDVLRSPEVQAERGSLAGTTHTTGRSLDLADGRVKNPDGVEITYTKFDSQGNPLGPSEYAVLFENEFRPAMERLAIENGFVLYKEHGHWHLYAPKDWDISFLAQGARVELGNKTEEASGHEQFDEAMDRVIQSLLDGRERASSEVIAQEMAAFAAKLAERYPESENRPTYHQILSQFSPPHPAAGLRKELIGIIRQMSSDDIVRYGVLEGTVLHDPKKAPFSDLEGIWEWKLKHKAGKDVKRYGPSTLKQLKGKSHSIDMATWYARQKAASAYFQKHGTDLGFSSDFLQYMDPVLVLAVMHAEFFSEFDGPTYVDLLPVVFETYNIVYGPAVNDKEYSAGVVQMIAPTFKALLNRYGEKLAEIQKDSSYPFLIPTSTVKTVEHKVKKGKKRRVVEKIIKEYDPETFAQSMVTDLDSQLFYGQLCIAYHIVEGFGRLMKDDDFQAAWQQGSEEDRHTFLAIFAAMAINRGRGGADQVAEILLEQVDGSTLQDYIEGISPAATTKWGDGNFGARGAERALSTMGYLLHLEAFAVPEEVPPSARGWSVDL